MSNDDEIFQAIYDRSKAGEFLSQRSGCKEYEVCERRYSYWKSKNYPGEMRRTVRKSSKSQHEAPKTAPKPAPKPLVMEIPEVPEVVEKKKDLSVVIIKGDTDEITKALKNMF